MTFFINLIRIQFEISAELFLYIFFAEIFHMASLKIAGLLQLKHFIYTVYIYILKNVA